MYPKTGCPEQLLNSAGPKFSERFTYLCGGFKEFLIAYQNFDFTSSTASENGGKPQIGFGPLGPQGDTTPPLWFPDLVQVNLQETPKSGQKRSTKHMTLSFFLDRFATHELRDRHDVVIRAFS